MKKSALLIALMTFATAAMASGGCHADYNRCQTPAQMAQAQHEAEQQMAQNEQSDQASAPAQDASAPSAQTSDNDAWTRINQQSVPTHSER